MVTHTGSGRQAGDFGQLDESVLAQWGFGTSRVLGAVRGRVGVQAPVARLDVHGQVDLELRLLDRPSR